MSVKQTVENVYLRQDAVQLTRSHFWRLLGMTLLLFGLTAALHQMLTLLGNTLLAAEIRALSDATEQYASSSRMTSYEPVSAAARAIVTSPKFLLMNLLWFIVTGLFSGGLRLGYNLQLIDTGRGGVPRVLGIFSRMRFCLKAWGLDLWTGLKIVLWLLPGIGVILLGAELALYNLDTLGTVLIYAGIILLFVLVIQASLRYSQAAFILADEPDRRIRDCVQFSAGLMKGRKGQFFKLCVPPLLKAAGLMLAVSLVGSLVLVALGLYESYAAAEILGVVAAVSIVYFLLQLEMVCALFYLKLREPAPDVPVSYWLREHPVDDAADDSPSDTPADTSPNTDEEAKENEHEQSDC